MKEEIDWETLKEQFKKDYPEGKIWKDSENENKVYWKYESSSEKHGIEGNYRNILSGIGLLPPKRIKLKESIQGLKETIQKEKKAIKQKKEEIKEGKETIRDLEESMEKEKKKLSNLNNGKVEK